MSFPFLLFVMPCVAFCAYCVGRSTWVAYFSRRSKGGFLKYPPSLPQHSNGFTMERREIER